MKIRHLIATAALGSAPMFASAGILGDMTQMLMSNTTAPSTLSTKDRVGVFGGSFEMRAPRISVNLVSFDPPRFDAGCGGVDLYGGSFSFIDSQQLVQIFRAVAANAVGLAFKAAIKAISPSLDQLITEFQTLLQHMNALAKNSCQLAHLIVDPAEKELANAVQGDGAIGSTLSGMVNDGFASLTTYLQNADHWLTEQAAVNPKSGNRNMKAIMNSGVSATLGIAGLGNFDGSPDDPTDPNSLNNRVLISLIGYDVVAIPCKNVNADGVADSGGSAPSSTLSNVTCTGAPTLTLHDLIDGGGPNSGNPDVPLQLYKCMNPAGATSGGIDAQICTSMQLAAYNYPGIRSFVNTALFGYADPAMGVDPGSIVGQFNSGGTINLTASHIQLIHQTGIPIVPLLAKTSNPAIRISIAQRLSEHVVACVASAVGQSLFKAANSVQTGGDTALSEDTKKNIERLRGDFLKQRDVCLYDHKILDVIQELNESLRLTARDVK